MADSGDESEAMELVDRATEQLANATTPVSGYAVAAAVRTPDGSVYAGSNHEVGTIDGTIHAEESAVVRALENGHETVDEIGIVTAAGDKATPCGMCRQTLVEVAGEDARVVCASPDGGPADAYRLGAIIPDAFVGENVGETRAVDEMTHPEVDAKGVDATLVERASEQRAMATTPYTGRSAGAAVLTPDGSVYAGSDHEFANFTNTIPAEQAAVVRALDHGHEAIERVAVVADERANAVPNGPSREFLAAYAGDDVSVLGAAPDGEGIDDTGLATLLPDAAGGVPTDERARSDGGGRSP